MMKRKKWTMILMSCLWCMAASARDVPVTMEEADSLFASRNLEALAAKYKIKEMDAEAAQAKLYANPVISIQENVYNRLNHRFFDFGSKSEQVYSIDQLIYIAGQHGNALRLANAKGETARYEFTDLLRRMEGEMHKTFVALYFAQRNIGMFKNEIVSLRKMLQQLITQEKKGNISKIETARIQALLLSLTQEQNQYLSNAEELQSKLKVFLSLPEEDNLVVAFNDEGLDRLAEVIPNWSEWRNAMEARPDLKQAASVIKEDSIRIKVEKSNAWPELHINGQYDRNGGYFPNYFAVGVTVSIPIFNRNQGNIRRAKAQMAADRYLYDNKRQLAKSELALAMEKLQRNMKLISTISNEYNKVDIETLFEGVNENYRKRNISLLEFVDFYNTYKNAKLGMADVRQRAFQAIEDVNTAAGKRVIQY